MLVIIFLWHEEKLTEQLGSARVTTSNFGSTDLQDTETQQIVGSVCRKHEAGQAIQMSRKEKKS